MKFNQDDIGNYIEGYLGLESLSISLAYLVTDADLTPWDVNLFEKLRQPKKYLSQDLINQATDLLQSRTGKNLQWVWTRSLLDNPDLDLKQRGARI